MDSKEKKTPQTKDSGEITDKLKDINFEELGFKGKPVVAEKFINIEMPPTGNREFDLESGRIAFKIGDQLIRSKAVGDIYFKTNFIPEEQYFKRRNGSK